MIHTKGRFGPNLGFFKAALVGRGIRTVPGAPALGRAGVLPPLLSAGAAAPSGERNGAGKIWGSVTNQRRWRFPAVDVDGRRRGF